MSSDATAISSNPEENRVIAGRYRLGRALGKGTYGQVFYAEDIKFDPPRAVAVKVLHQQFLNDAQSREDIRREASVLARFHHPNILRVSDFEISPDLAYIVTDFAEGGSLADKLKPEKSAPPIPMPLNEVIYYLEQIASALDEAHNIGLIHRDIKPLNILLDRAGRPLLADFGLATVLSGTSSSMEDMSASGTPLYMAPEQWAGKAGKASDIYALGVVTYQLITGQPPYTGNQAALWAQHTGSAIPTLKDKAPWLDYPPALDAVIAGVMAKDDRERTRPAGEFARRFKMALLGYQATPYNYPKEPPPHWQGPSGSIPTSGFNQGSNLPPSTVPPNMGTNQPPYNNPGSQPFYRPPGGFGYENGPSGPLNVYPATGQQITGNITGQPGFSQGGSFDTRPQSGGMQPGSQTNGSNGSQPIGSQPGSQPGNSQQFGTQPPGMQGGMQAGSQNFNSQGLNAPTNQQSLGPNQNQTAQPGLAGGVYSPNGPNQQPYWQGGPNPPGGQFPPNGQPLLSRPTPPVTKKKSSLNLLLIGIAAIIVIAIAVVAVLIFLPKNTGPQTPTQVAANVTATPGGTGSITATPGNGTPTTPDQTSVANLTPGAAGTGQVQVSVTESTGKPARQGDVTIKVYKVGNDDVLQTVDSKANVNLTLPAGNYTILATYPNDIAVTSKPFEVKEGQTIQQAINLGVGTAQIQVVEAEGHSARAGDLALRIFKAGDTSKAVTTIYGRANTTVYLLPGSYEMETDYSNDFKDFGKSFEIKEGATTTQNVNLGVGTAEVQIFETAGKIVASDGLVIRVIKANDPNTYLTTIYNQAKPSITLKKGSYQLLIEYNGVVKVTGPAFDVKAGETVNTSVTLGIGTLNVTVQNADGSPADGNKLTIRVFDPADTNDALNTQYNVAQATVYLKAGTYVVEVEVNVADGSNQKFTGDPIAVKEGQTVTQTVKIK